MSPVTTGAVALVVAGILAGVAPAATVPGGSAAPPGSPIESAAPIDGYDGVDVRIHVEPDGTAHWTVEYDYVLPDEKARNAFDREKRNLSPNTLVEPMREEVVPVAESRTGREMEVGNGTVLAEKSVPDGREGTVVYRFTWTNFVDTSPEDRVVVGDAISGIDFDGNESLAIEWGGAFRKSSVSPPPDESDPDEVVWNHPLEFGSRDPRVELVPIGGGLPILPAVVVGGVALAVVAGWYGRSRWLASSDDGPDGDPEVAAGSDPTGEPGPEAPPEELLTDEERVIRLLEAKGGRMKQQDLIEAVDWSRTKASDVVNEMHEAEQIEVYQLGRENVLALPGEIEV